MSSEALTNKPFINANQEMVEYDGSPLLWRASVYALIIQENQIFIIKNKLEKFHDIVGGGVEFGETLTEALQREALEEAGALIEVGELLQAETSLFYHRSGQYYQTLQLFYKAQLTTELKENTDDNIEWKGFVPLSSIGTQYRLPPLVEKIVKKLVSET